MSNVLDFPSRVSDMQRRLAKLNYSTEIIESGGGTYHNGDMERRVSKLEDRMDSVQEQLFGIRETLARIDERISHLPTYKGIGFLFSSIIASAAALTAVLHYCHIF